MSKTINFGIDLGTTNSTIAHYKAGEVEILKNPLNLKTTLPSVIAYRKNKILVGDKAREILNKDPLNTFAHFKRKMGTADKYFIPNTDDFKTPIELSAIILKELKKFVFTQHELSSVVITIPAAFDTVQSNATKEAGLQAGFQEVVLLQEPIAASLAYANKASLELKNNKWLVYDLGGGTFDVALVTIDEEEMKVLDHEGDNFLGGTDIDALILNKIILPQMKVAGQFGDLESEITNSSGKYAKLYNLLLYKAEEAKIMLSNVVETEIEFEVEDDTGEEIELFFTVSRDELDALIAPFVKRTAEMIEQVIDRNEVSKTDIDFVLMVGGSTYIPFVRTYIEEKLGLSVNCQIDPTTAIGVGAAYYAGMKVGKFNEKPTESVSGKSPVADLKVDTAYSKVAREKETIFLAKIEGDVANKTYRIIRLDGGFDSGEKPLVKDIYEELPLVENVYNEFVLKMYDAKGNTLNVAVAPIGITHGKFSIDGQPLPNDICLEVDSLEEGTTMLEPIFKKNAILPLKKSISKEISKHLYKSSEESIVLNIVEGSVDNLPAANKTIGFVKIMGKDLERDLVRGSDIEMTFEMSESRDLKVEVYLSMTGQEYVNVFSPTERLVDMELIRKELETFTTNLKQKQTDAERNENYEQAASAQQLLVEVSQLLQRVDAYHEDNITDEKYQIDIEKMKLAARLNKLYTKNVLTKIFEKYYEAKKEVSAVFAYSNDTLESDREELRAIVENEKEYIQEGNPSFIKMKTSQIEAVARKVGSRRKVTNEDVVAWFHFLKSYPYQDRVTANGLIQEGEESLEANNIPRLSGVVNQLYMMKEKDENGNSDLFRNSGTGIK